MTFCCAVTISCEHLVGGPAQVKRCVLFPHFLPNLSNAHFSELFEKWFHFHAPLFLTVGNRSLFLLFATLRKLLF